MHFVFIPYGMRRHVETMLRDMEAQKTLVRLHKEGDPEKGQYIQAQIRQLPFGIYEYICAKEEADAVMTSLKFDEQRYDIGWINMTMLRKLSKCEPIPKFKKDNKMLWITDNVNIIPLGVRYDLDVTEPAGLPLAGWTHEAI